MPWLRALLALCLGASVAAADDWPQWLGPRRDSSSSERVQPWKAAPQKAWSVAVGEGHSSPVVAGGKVFLHSKVKDQDAEEVAAFDVGSGKRVWRKTYSRGAFSSVFGNGPRATPCVADGKVYTYGVTGVLSCLNADDGQILWQIDALKEFAASNLKFGISSSPLLDGDNVLIMVGGGTTVVAVDKNKGTVVWKSEKDAASYASPILIGNGKERQAVFVTEKGVTSLNPTDGAVYWKIPLVDLLSESSTTPVRIENLLLASSVTFGSLGVKLETKDGKPAATQAWKNSTLTCYFATPVAIGSDYVYMVTGAVFPPQSTLRCVQAKTGTQLWYKDKVGKYHATLLRTGDNKLLMLDDAGNLVFIDPSPESYRELARAKVCGATWAHPALANGRLYLRDEKELICLKLAD